MTILQAVSIAGGLDPELADPRAITIRRKTAGGTQDLHVDLDALGGAAIAPLIEPDDQVVVGILVKTRFCVKGPVIKPDCYESSVQPTIEEVLSLAGGLDPEIADSNNILVRRVADGKVKEINVELPPGRLMGELGFLSPDNKRTATVTCLEDGHVLSITYEKLLEIYFQNPQFGYYFLVLTSQRLLENIARLERIIAQNKLAQPAPN